MRRAPVRVVRTIAADQLVAFGLLADLEEHWRLAGSFVEVLALDGPAGSRRGAVLRVHGPLGLQRTVRTRLLAAAAPRVVAGTASAGRRTCARVAWRLGRADAGTTVELSVTVLRAGLVDRALLALGGRRWLRGQLVATIERLAVAAGRDARPRDADVAA